MGDEGDAQVLFSATDRKSLNNFLKSSPVPVLGLLCATVCTVSGRSLQISGCGRVAEKSRFLLQKVFACVKSGELVCLKTHAPNGEIKCKVFIRRLGAIDASDRAESLLNGV